MSRNLISVAALLSFAWFIRDAAGRGWSRTSTDFPNYYTAALLARTHQPLHRYYEWGWFQRQMDFSIPDHQLGGYIPQTPLTMTPFIPLSFFSPLTARRVWFVLNFFFLGLSLWLISRMTRFTIAQLWLLVFLGYFTLRSNFELGQYYLFLLAIMTVAVYSLHRKKELAGGLLIGIAMALKLYGAPLLLLAACRRKWRVAGGIALALLVSLVSAVGVFGLKDILFFATQVLPRAMAGETLNPYHPSNSSVVTMLRRLLVAEGELNPSPLVDSPATFLFLSSLFTLCVTLFPAVAATSRSGELSNRTLAWWLIGMLLVSPNTASYTFALAILPVALLLDDLSGRTRIWLLAAYVLLTLPLWPAWSSAFPRAWLLLAMFLIAGWSELRPMPPRVALISMAAFALVSAAVTAVSEIRTAAPDRQQIIAKAALYSASPVVSPTGLIYESIGADRYVLRQGSRTFAFNGDAFHPTIPDSGGPIYFELVNGPLSAIMRFDEQTGVSVAVPVGVSQPQAPASSHDGTAVAFTSNGALYIYDGQTTREIADGAHDPSFVRGDRGIIFATEGDTRAVRQIDLNSGHVTTLTEGWRDIATPSVSPDRKHLLFAARTTGTWQIWVQDLSSHKGASITTGHCNNITPAWNGSGEIVFASDCRRGLGLPALFRTPLKQIAQFALKTVKPKTVFPFEPAIPRESHP